MSAGLGVHVFASSEADKKMHIYTNPIRGGFGGYPQPRNGVTLASTGTGYFTGAKIEKMHIYTNPRRANGKAKALSSELDKAFIFPVV